MPKWHPRMLIDPGYPGVIDVKRQAWVVHKTKRRSPDYSAMMPQPSNPPQVPLLKTQGIFLPSFRSDSSSFPPTSGGDMPYGGDMSRKLGFGGGIDGGLPFGGSMGGGMPFGPGMGGMMPSQGSPGVGQSPDLGQHGRMDYDPVRAYNTQERYPPGDSRRKS